MDGLSNFLQSEYQLRFAENASYRNEVWKILCRQYFSKFVAADAHVLDLGAGWGEFINNVDAARKYAMDLNPETGLRLSGATQFLNQDCSEQWQVPRESLHVVFTSNFLEHLPDKGHVDRTISEAFNCLRQDGVIICLGPNIKYLPGAYWDFWDHLVPLTEMSLVELLRMKGFRIELCLPRFLPYSMSTGSKPPLIALKLYLKLPALWPLFGKQFLVVARKVATAQPGAAKRCS